MSAATITPEDLDHARGEVERLEALHDTQHTAATSRMAEMRTAVEDDDAPRPTAGEINELFATADTTARELDAARALLSRLHGQRNGYDPQDQRPAPAGAARTPGQFLADALLGHEAFQALAASGASVADLEDVDLTSAEEFAAMLSATASVPSPVAAQFDGGPLVPDDQSRVGTMRGLPQRATTILDWVAVGTTTSDSVPYSRHTTETLVIEGRAPGVAAPESTIVVAADTEEIRDRLTEMTIPVRNLEDNGRLRSWIDRRLEPGLRRDAEDQVLNGTGVGENMTGITNWAGVGAYERQNGEALADAIHQGITAVRVALLEEPTGVAINAEDYHTMLLDKDSTGAYRNSGGPFAPVPMSLWGKPTAIAHILNGTGRSIIGKWDEDELVVRMGIKIEEFRQNRDNASKRLTTLLGLYRAANIIERPYAFCVVNTVEAAPPV